MTMTMSMTSESQSHNEFGDSHSQMTVVQAGKITVTILTVRINVDVSQLKQVIINHKPLHCST